MDPGGQPASNIPATRYRRQVMKLVKEIMACQALQDPQSEGCATNAPTRQAQRGSLLLLQTGVKFGDELLVHLQLGCRLASNDLLGFEIAIGKRAVQRRV